MSLEKCHFVAWYAGSLVLSITISGLIESAVGDWDQKNGIEPLTWTKLQRE
jgi:hypothetical protein